MQKTSSFNVGKSSSFWTKNYASCKLLEEAGARGMFDGIESERTE